MWVTPRVPVQVYSGHEDSRGVKTHARGLHHIQVGFSTPCYIRQQQQHTLDSSTGTSCDTVQYFTASNQSRLSRQTLAAFAMCAMP